MYLNHEINPFHSSDCELIYIQQPIMPTMTIVQEKETGRLNSVTQQDFML